MIIVIKNQSSKLRKNTLLTTYENQENEQSIFGQ